MKKIEKIGYSNTISDLEFVYGAKLNELVDAEGVKELWETGTIKSKLEQ